MSELVFTTPPAIPANGGWVDLRDQAVLADMRRMREEEQAARLRLQNEPQPVDPLVLANRRIAELEAEVQRLKAALEDERANNPVSPHLKRVERRS